MVDGYGAGRLLARRMRFTTWTLGAVLLLAGVACVEKQPQAGAVANAPGPSGPAVTAPTGKYGEVASKELTGTGIAAFALQGKAERATVSLVPVAGQPFAQALRAEVKEKSGNP